MSGFAKITSMAPTANVTWSDEDVVLAKAAINNGMTIRQAAIIFNIPCSSLTYRLKMADEQTSSPQSRPEEAAQPHDVSPFSRAYLNTGSTDKIPLRDYAVAYLRHHDVLHETSRSDDSARKLAYQAMADVLKISTNKVRVCLPQFRKTFYHCMVQFCRNGGSRRNIRKWAPYWVDLIENKLNMLPRALEEVSVHGARKSQNAGKLSPASALRLIVAYCRRHRVLCSSALYAELRLALHCGMSELHAVWVNAQRVCVQQLAALCRAGDAPAAAPRSPAAWRVADLVLTYTDVDTHRILTDESVTLYDELQALSMLFTLVQKHRVEDSRAADQLARSWTSVFREYTASGKLSSMVVLQRRWHELKLQTRSRLMDYWQDSSSQPAPALIHVDIAKKFPHVVREAAPGWRQLVAAGLVAAAPLEDEPSPGGKSAAENADSEKGKDIALDTPDDNQDDDVQLIEKHVETIDVDSESDTEDRLVIDLPTGNHVPTQIKKPVDTNTSIKGKTSPSNDVTNEATPYKTSENQVMAPILVRQLINVASVESINNRFQESIKRQSIANIGQTYQVTIPNDNTPPITSAEKDIDSTQTLAILKTLDPNKVRTEIIFESDSEDDSVENHPCSISINDQNTPNETQIVIGNVTSGANDAMVNEDKEITNTGRRDDTNNTETADASRHTNINSTGEAEQVDGLNTSTASAANITVKPLNSDSEGVTMRDIAANSGYGDTAEATVANSDRENKNSIAMDVDSEFGTNAYSHSDTRDVITNSESATHSKIEVTVDTIIKGVVNYATKIENGIEISAEIKVENSEDVVSKSRGEICGSESDGLEDEDNGLEESLVDPKLIMETRVDVIKLHDTDAWMRYSRRNKYININQLDMATLQPTNKNNEKMLIEIEINDTPVSNHGSCLVKSENIANTDTMAIDEITDSNSNTISALEMPIDENNKSLDNEDSSSTSSDSSYDEDFIPYLKRHKPTAKGVKHSIASGVCEWSSNYEKVFSGRDGSKVRRKYKGLRRKIRVAKRVQLPDIEEVRRVNRNILTAQVAPISAGESIIEVQDSSSNQTVRTYKRADRSARANKSADNSVNAENRPVPSVSVDKPTDQVVDADKPADQVAGADVQADQAAGADGGRGWPGGQVPSRRELDVVLNKLTAELRRSGLSCGLPAPAYCCAARRHRSVNDARRRICASAPEILLHVHADGACSCCCRHVLDEAQQRAQLDGDVTRLERDLRSLLRARTTQTSNSSSKPSRSSSKSAKNGSKKASNGSKQASSGSSKKDKKNCSKKKSKEDTTPTEETSNADPLAEWERQKSVNAQYFHISSGNRKRRSVDTEKHNNTETTPTSKTKPMNVDDTQGPSGTMRVANSTNSNAEVEVTDQGIDTNILNNIMQERKVAGVNVQNKMSAIKIMKILPKPASKPYSLVVTSLKDPQRRYKKVVKLHTNPNCLLKPVQLNREYGTKSTPIMSIEGSLSNLNTAANTTGLVSVASSAASDTAVPSGLLALPSSSASVTAQGTGLVNVASSAASFNAVPSGLLALPSSAASVTAQVTGLVNVASRAASFNAVPSGLLALPSSAASVTAQGTGLVNVASSAASISAVPSGLMSLLSSAASDTAQGNGLVNVASSATSFNAVPSSLIALPSYAASISTLRTGLVNVATSAASFNAVPSGMLALPSSVATVTAQGSGLVNVASSTASFNAVPSGLIALPSYAASISTLRTGLENVATSAASFNAVPSGLLALPSSAASVSAPGTDLINVASSAASFNAVPSGSGNVASVGTVVNAGVATPVVRQANIITERPNHEPSTPASESNRPSLLCIDASEPPGFMLTKDNISKSLTLATQQNNPVVSDNTTAKCDVQKENSKVAGFVDKVTVEKDKRDIEKVHSGDVSKSVGKVSVEKDNSGDCGEKCGVRDVCENTTFKRDVKMKRCGVGVSFIDRGSVEMATSGDRGEKMSVGGILNHNIDKEKRADVNFNTGNCIKAERSSKCKVYDDEIVILDSDEEKDKCVNKDSLITGNDVTEDVNSNIELISDDDENGNSKTESSNFIQVNDNNFNDVEPQSKIRKIYHKNISVYDNDDCMLYNDDSSDRIEFLVDSKNGGFSDLENANQSRGSGIKKLRIKKTVKNKRRENVSYTDLYLVKVNEATNKDPTKSSEDAALNKCISIDNLSMSGSLHMPAAVTDMSKQLIKANGQNHTSIDKKSNEVVTYKDSIGLSGGMVKIFTELSPASVRDIPSLDKTCQNESSLRTYAKKVRGATEMFGLTEGTHTSVGSNDLLNIVQEITRSASAALPLKPHEVTSLNSTKPSEVTTSCEIIDISEDISVRVGDSSSSVSLAEPCEVIAHNSEANRTMIYISEGNNDDTTENNLVDTDVMSEGDGSVMPVIMSTVSLAEPSVVTTLSSDENNEIIDISDGDGDLTSTVSVGYSDLFNMGRGIRMPVLVSAVSLAKPSEVTTSNSDALESSVGASDKPDKMAREEAMEEASVPESATSG